MVLLCGIAGNSFAHDEPATEVDKGPWSGQFALGYLSSSGNTDESSATAEFRIGYDLDVWHHSLKGRGYGASKDKATTAESYQLGWKSIFDFSEFNYVFGAVDWNKDRFSGYTEQTFETLGYGRRVLNTPDLVLNLEAGVGFAQQTRAANLDAIPPIFEKKENGAQANVGGNLLWNFSENAAFEQTLYVFKTSDNTRWESVSKVRAGLVGNVGLALSYTIKQNSDVPEGIEKTDRYTALTLDYAF